MKRILLCCLFLLIYSSANATLITIGTAGYDSDGDGVEESYNLIWDDNNNGNSVVWLDYTNQQENWENQVDWADDLTGNLTYNINSGYTVDWGGSRWRLPTTEDVLQTPETEYNNASSEMGHLFYEELENTGFQNTDGSYNLTPPPPKYFLQNTGDFNSLIADWYWSGTEYALTPEDPRAWFFVMSVGAQGTNSKNGYHYGLSLRTGQVSIVSPVPEPATMLLFGLGILVLAWVSRKKIKTYGK